MEDLIKHIAVCRGSFSKGQRAIADYIAENYDEAAFMTAAKLGERAGVSESTVVRFAYSIGLDGYPALQEKIQEMIRSRLTSVQRVRLTAGVPQDELLRTVLSSDMNNIRATIDTIDEDSFRRSVDVLLKAGRIYVLGVRSSMPLARFLAYYLGFVCDNVAFLDGDKHDIYEQMIRIGAGDVCFGISFPRYSARTAEVMRFAKKQGAAVIALTDQPESPLAASADCVLCAKSSMASFADSLVAPLSVINALIAAVGQARPDEAYKHLSKLEEIWSEEHVYLTERNGENPANSEEEPTARPESRGSGRAGKLRLAVNGGDDPA